MIGVVADDFTGANDIGIMFTLNGYRTYVYSIYDDVSIIAHDADAIILNTNSRLDDRTVAYDKARLATRTLKLAGCSIFHKKTCSVFRGNIGAEFDAMLDELGVEFCAVVLGFPRTGRITKDGLHYVHGKLLEESAFKDDPTHPMRESNLVSILQKQTQRKVGLIDYRVVAGGTHAIKDAIDALRDKFQYVIFDVLSQDDLYSIAGAVKDEIALAGSSAIGEELPKWLAFKGRGAGPLPSEIRESRAGTLIIAGSVTPQTREQVEFAKARGIPHLVMGADSLLDGAEAKLVIERYSAKAIDSISNGRHMMIHTENEVGKVLASKATGRLLGLDEREVGRIVSRAISAIVGNVAAATGLSRLIVLGGETSGAICDELGIVGNLVLKEISPGVPSVLTLGKTRLLMAPKSGSFGSADFIITAIEHLKGIRGAS